jgi:cell division protein FtsZ
MLESSVQGARGILLNITGGLDLALHEVNDAAQAVMRVADRDANIIFGAAIDPRIGDELRVTIIATGIGHG